MLLAAIFIRLKQSLQRYNGNTLEPGEWPEQQTDVTTTSTQYDGGKLQVIGTSHEVIDAGDLTDTVLCRIRNRSSTATVQVGRDVAATFYPLVDIPPGEEAHLPRLNSLAGTYLQSDEASTEVLIALHKISA